MFAGSGYGIRVKRRRINTHIWSNVLHGRASLHPLPCSRAPRPVPHLDTGTLFAEAELSRMNYFVEGEEGTWTGER
jgi:hypothetical protein